jgi:hypothetical protein
MCEQIEDTLFSRVWSANRFGDSQFAQSSFEEAKWRCYCEAIKSILNQDPTTSVVFLEVGVGLRLPRLRKALKEIQQDIPENQCTYARINPAQESIDKSDRNVIFIHQGCKDALTKLQSFL